MKLIQAMKKLKDLKAKADDLRAKVGQHCALLTFETPQYGEKQQEQVSGWIQAHHDVVKEVLGLRVAIQRTNLATKVPIELDGKHVTKTIAEWIHRRRDLSQVECLMWQQLTDRGLKEQNVQTSPGGPLTEIRVRRFFDPVERDKNIAAYKIEASVIDAALEIANAMTELTEE